MTKASYEAEHDVVDGETELLTKFRATLGVTKVIKIDAVGINNESLLRDPALDEECLSLV
jgi:hypothetical protein